MQWWFRVQAMRGTGVGAVCGDSQHSVTCSGSCMWQQGLTNDGEVRRGSVRSFRFWQVCENFLVMLVV